jgi:hypothetical protein
MTSRLKRKQKCEEMKIPDPSEWCKTMFIMLDFCRELLRGIGLNHVALTISKAQVELRRALEHDQADND